MYLKRITIKNIKCFAHLEIDFMSGTNARLWTSVLGQNGLGKSTLLQAISVALAGPGAMRELLPVPEGWVRNGCPYGEIEAELLWTEGDAQTPRWPKNKKTPYIARYIVTGDNPELLPQPFNNQLTVPTIVDWPGELTGKDREIISKDMSRLKQTAYAEGKIGWFSCGYGPFRRLSGGGQEADRILYSERKSARFITLFREDAALTNATDWLMSLYNKGRDGDTASERILGQVKNAFRKNLLPRPAELLVNSSSVQLQIEQEKPLQFRDLSDGYRSMLAVSIDILRWMSKSFPDSPNIMENPGVVLIDELDAHAHPAWQREIGHWLKQKFPQLQFIIATHSPFLAQVADEPGGYIILEETEAGIDVRRSTESVGNWRADQILTELFDLPTTRSPQVEERLQRLQALMQRQQRLSDAERQEFEQLRLWSETIPPSIEDTAERQLAEVLQDVVDQLKDRISAIQ